MLLLFFMIFSSLLTTCALSSSARSFSPTLPSLLHMPIMFRRYLTLLVLKGFVPRSAVFSLVPTACTVSFPSRIAACNQSKRICKCFTLPTPCRFVIPRHAELSVYAFSCTRFPVRKRAAACSPIPSLAAPVSAMYSASAEDSAIDF